jgi:hypothetical protein
LTTPTFVAGKIQLTTSDVNIGNIPAGSGTEVVGGVCTSATAAGTYHFRFRRNDVELNTYTVSPSFTLQTTPGEPSAGGLSIGGGVTSGGKN